MKIRNILIWLILGNFMLLTTSAIAQENEIISVDRKKIRSKKFTKFIDHVFWYPKEIIDSKKIPNKLIPEDMQKFKFILKKALRPEYLVSEKILDSNSIAVENIRDANDYILLEYKCNKRRIQIQDGKVLYIGIFPDGDLKIEQPDLTQYVKLTALQILNIPEFDEEGQEPQVCGSTSSIWDIGDSKLGSLTYLKPPLKLWYSNMQWWSDRRNVLFMVGKLGFFEDLSKRAGPPEDLLDPRKFKKDK